MNGIVQTTNIGGPGFGVPSNVSRPLNIEAKNSAVAGGAGWQDIWEGGAAIIPEPLEAGETLTIKSSDANDTIAGSGAQVVRIEYIKDGELLSIDKDMDGVAEVVVDTLITDVIDLYVVQPATLNAAAIGNIDIIRQATPAVIFNRIKAGGNKSLSSLRHLLPNSTFYLTSMTVSSDSKGIDFALRSTSNDSGDVLAGYLFRVPMTLTDAPVHITFNPALVIPGTARLKASAQGQQVSSVSLYLNGWVKI